MGWGLASTLMVKPLFSLQVPASSVPAVCRASCRARAAWTLTTWVSLPGQGMTVCGGTDVTHCRVCVPGLG